MPRYDSRRIEPKWQAFWETHQTFRVAMDPARPKMYVLDMFPYPSGQGLHVGHPEGYTATDIVCRYQRMRGKCVLHPMGWDAFGLPAEEHAVATGIHPREKTRENIDEFRRQLKMLGFSYDWSREISTTSPEYYRWTQWIFLQIYDTWFDPECEWTGPDGVRRIGRGRPIDSLPIPAEIGAQGSEAVRRYQDQHRLAFQHEAPVNWCPALGTVLANEEVVDGKSERGEHPVVRLPLRQWMLRITSYADRLSQELESLDWSESIKSLQRNWIGRSEGAELDFYIGDPGGFEAWKTARAATGYPAAAASNTIRVYTTRPDTLFGVTYMVLSPEHPLVDQLCTASQREAIASYRQQASLKSDLDRTDLAKTKTGVFTGGYAINPLNGQQVPVWVADYVLISYGTGAIMAVPAHDERDLEFANTFDIEVKPVVAPTSAETDAANCVGYFGEGFAINSGKYNGLTTSAFKQRIREDLANGGFGRAAVNYRLRDWLFSRQRYWGEPFPLWHELDEQGQPTGLIRTESVESLPVPHPHLEDFKPTGTPEPMLSKAPEEWLYKTDTDGKRLKRETNSMPQWAGSCWYYLRFADPLNDREFISPEAEKYWLPVDLYIGGAEHAVLHLLYSRFWHKVLFDRGHVSTAEPFQKLVNQGMILGEVEFTGSQRDGQWISSRGVSDNDTTVTRVRLTEEAVEKKGDSFVLKGMPDLIVDARSYKMSKSRGNVINPDRVVSEYGADSLRLYEMFMGPLEASKPWSMSGVEGIFRFLGRVWRLFVDEKSDDVVLCEAVVASEATVAQRQLLHKTIKSVTDDIDRMSFNTAISRMMEFVNAMTSEAVRPRSILEPFVLLLSPLAPHLAEEIWELLGHQQTLAYEPWPEYDPALLVASTIEIPVQVNGKLKGKIVVAADADQPAIEQAANSEPGLAAVFAGKTVVKVVYVPGRLLNFVVK